MNSKNTLTLIKFMHFGLWVLYFLCVCFCAISSYVRCNVMCIIEPVSCKHCPNKSQHELVFTEDKPTEKKSLYTLHNFVFKSTIVLSFIALLRFQVLIWPCFIVSSSVISLCTVAIAKSHHQLEHWKRNVLMKTKVIS